MKKELLFMGPPASGKGTHTSGLSKEMNLPHVDTGSLLRAAIKNETEAGKIAKEYVNNGQLVPAEIVARIIKERLLEADCQNGFILDGFPRSVEQADMLEDILKEVDAGRSDVEFIVINFDIDGDVLLERIINRESCATCGKIYNRKFTPAKVAGICDDCGAALVQRKDDTKEVAELRFKTYYAETAPLIEYYEKKGVLKELDARGDKAVVTERLKKLI